MKYRNEVKHVITPSDALAVQMNMSAIAEQDPHAGPDGSYRVRSLYFDNLYDLALREKIDGVSEREKFRIRFYGENTGFIRLEKKVKRGDVGCKISAPVTGEEVARLIMGDTSWMPVSGRGLVMELYSKMQTRLLRPKAIVDYHRTAFVYAPGNVRVTIDRDIRTDLSVKDFLDARAPMLPAGNGEIILEVKWDEFLPLNIRRAVRLDSRRPGAFSKYQAARIYY